AEDLLKFGRVGHGEAGAVDEEDPGALPARARAVVAVGVAAAGDGAHQAVEEGNGEAAAGLAVGGVGEVDLGEVAQVGAGGVAMQDLLGEEESGDGGSEGALAEGAGQVTADLQGQRRGQRLGQIALDVPQGLRESRHGDLLGVMTTFPSSSSQEVPPSPSPAENIRPS